jgi:hypothetical protein
MINLSVPMPEGVFSVLRLDSAGLTRKMCITSAMPWYAQARISQDKAAEIAGLNRAAFIDTLSQAPVSRFQFRAEDSLRTSRVLIERVIINVAPLITLFRSLPPMLFHSVFMYCAAGRKLHIIKLGCLVFKAKT